MKVLLTGGSGFIGGKLLAGLLERGDEVYLVTRNKNRVTREGPKLRIIEADISQKDPFAGIATVDADIAVHCAARMDYYGDKRLLYASNLAGTLNVAEFSSACGVKRFVYLSSIEVLGLCSTAEAPVDEDRVPMPVSPYGRSKLAGERAALNFCRTSGISASSLRLGNVYGPGSAAFVMPVIGAILHGGVLRRYLPLYKDFLFHPVFIDDVVSGIMAAMDKAAAGSVYTIAGREYVSVGDFMSVVADTLGITFRSGGAAFYAAQTLKLRNLYMRLTKRADLLSYFTAGAANNEHRAYSIKKAERELQWRPVVGLKEGVNRTIAAFKASGVL